ncbi:MAG: hypothetical protein J7K72_02130 [Candidatus Aenigmarchaeota archaeon]|nr:hypothetical protein [Candidatus Aenigmarchaeota archaeon]
MVSKGKPRLKEEEPVTKEEARIEEASPVEQEKKIVVKKWKGKEWFDVISPPDFDGKPIGQTPATDPKSIIGRVVEVGVPELTGDNSKYYMKLKFQIYKLQGKSAFTHFKDFECVREYLLRMVRKRNQKVEVICDAMTKDGWVLRFKPWIILRRNTPAGIQNKIRNMVVNVLSETASKNTISDIIKKTLSTEIQLMLKKEGNKIYPVRFAEMARIKVLRTPEISVVEKPKEQPKKEKKPKTEEKKKSTK